MWNEFIIGFSNDNRWWKESNRTEVVRMNEWMKNVESRNEWELDISMRIHSAECMADTHKPKQASTTRQRWVAIIHLFMSFNFKYMHNVEYATALKNNWQWIKIMECKRETINAKKGAIFFSQTVNQLKYYLAIVILSFCLFWLFV